ncbi:hypothetical protein Scep_006953 [Stephania cephalantha]|uniref:Uncharacterized protein n=1 Tax=Stephania cephalantha TaxID=152367 RepID=A0AAP0PPJ3_9MAGN
MRGLGLRMRWASKEQEIKQQEKQLPNWWNRLESCAEDGDIVGEEIGDEAAVGVDVVQGRAGEGGAFGELDGLEGVTGVGAEVGGGVGGVGGGAGRRGAGEGVAEEGRERDDEEEESDDYLPSQSIH